MMRVERQLSVFMENRPGGLAKVCGILSEAGINIYALTVHDTVDHAIVRLVGDKHIKALLLLEQQGLYLIEQEVVVLDLDNRPGALADIARKLAHADINIEYAYCSAIHQQHSGCLVLKTSDAEMTLRILGDQPPDFGPPDLQAI